MIPCWRCGLVSQFTDGGRGTGTPLTELHGVNDNSAFADLITFQAVLNEADGSIQFNSLDLSAGAAGDEGRSATVGVKDVYYPGPRRVLLAQDSGPNEFVGTHRSTLITPSTTPPADLFAFTVAANGRVTLAVTGVSVALLDPVEAVLQAGTNSGTNVGE